MSYFSIAYIANASKRLPPEGFQLAALQRLRERVFIPEGSLEAHYNIQYGGKYKNEESGLFLCESKTELGSKAEESKILKLQAGLTRERKLRLDTFYFKKKIPLKSISINMYEG